MRVLWRRIVCRLATLCSPCCPLPLGQHTLQFFIADGRYRQQVFALDDHRDSKIVIYGPDVMEAGADPKGILLPPPDPGEPRALWHPRQWPRRSVSRAALDSANTPNPDPSFKFMLGWNRRALRMTLLVRRHARSRSTPPSSCGRISGDARFQACGLPP